MFTATPSPGQRLVSCAALLFGFVAATCAAAVDYPRGMASVSRCAAGMSCLPDGTCADVTYTAAMLTLEEFDVASGAARTAWFFIGPHREGAGGGMFHRTEQVPVVSEPGADAVELTQTTDSAVHAFWVVDPGTTGITYVRPAREVPGLGRDGRAITRFNCEQVLF